MYLLSTYTILKMFTRPRHTMLLASVASLLGGIQQGNSIVHPKMVDDTLVNPDGSPGKMRMAGNNKVNKVNRTAEKRRKKFKQMMRRRNK